VRIISGTLRGKIIRAPDFSFIRPTTDFAKSGLFNVLANHFDFSAVTVLDLFCGTGNISFEFLSRKAVHVTCVDHTDSCIRFIKTQLKALRFDNALAIKSDAFAFLNNCSKSFDIIIADPPYQYGDYEKLVDKIFEKKLLTGPGMFILEHHHKIHFDTHVNFAEQRKYGNVGFSFFR